MGWTQWNTALTVCSLFWAATGAWSQESQGQAMKTIYVDACDRHRVQIAEMSRGAGANSNEIESFISWLEINTYAFAYRDLLEGFGNRNDVFDHVLQECAKDPTETIGQILYNFASVEIDLESLAALTAAKRDLEQEKRRTKLMQLQVEALREQVNRLTEPTE